VGQPVEDESASVVFLSDDDGHHDLDVAFKLRSIQGHVSIAYARNDRPDQVGSGAASFGFPVCHATVNYPARGYNAVLGWVQLVRSGDNTSHGRAFEIDPLEFLGDVPHPFCWIGVSPDMFDAPSRSPRHDLDWTAHTFLCVPEGSTSSGLSVHALLGFAWGFRIRNDDIHLVPPTPLGAKDWDQHVNVLASRYPSWRFAEGFHIG